MDYYSEFKRYCSVISIKIKQVELVSPPFSTDTRSLALSETWSGPTEQAVVQKVIFHLDTTSIIT